MSERKPPRASRPNLPGYGIAAEDEGEGLLPWSWAVSRLASARNYFLSTVTDSKGENGGPRPHVMPIWGLWLDDTPSSSAPARSRARRRTWCRNPRCVICPEGGEEAIVVEGVAEIREETPADFARAYQAKYDVDVAAMGQPIFVVLARGSSSGRDREDVHQVGDPRWIFDGV